MVDGIYKEIVEGELVGNLANSGSPGRMVVKPACVTLLVGRQGGHVACTKFCFSSPIHLWETV